MEKLITREELYKIVWQTPIAKIAIDLQIGVSALREKCHDNKIPLPPNGYWSKLKYGKKVNKIPMANKIGSTGSFLPETIVKTKRNINKPNIK